MEKSIDDWGKWIVRGIITGTCIFLIKWGYKTSETLEAINITLAAQVEKNRSFDDKNAVQDFNITTLFTGRDHLQQQVSELFRYHPKKD